jgi:hypothetical protein
MSQDAFLKAIGTTSWTSLPGLVAKLDAKRFWEEEWLARSVHTAKTAYARKLIRSLKDEDDYPLFASVETEEAEEGAAGAKVRIYKQESLFTVDDYRQTIGYWRGYVAHGQHMLNHYVHQAQAKFPGQIEMDS